MVVFISRTVWRHLWEYLFGKRLLCQKHGRMSVCFFRVLGEHADQFASNHYTNFLFSSMRVYMTIRAIVGFAILLSTTYSFGVNAVDLTVFKANARLLPALSSAPYTVLNIPPSSNYISQIALLKKRARDPDPSEQEKNSFLKFCECRLNAVLEEFKYRKTYFFTQAYDPSISDLMVTVWPLRKDGASIPDITEGRFNASINGNPANVSIGRAEKDSSALWRVVWFKNAGLSNETIVEVSARLTDPSEQKISSLMRMLDISLKNLDLLIQ